MSEYKLASAEDFRRALREFLEEEIKKHVSEGQPETLTLPTKGLVVTLRHPGPLAARSAVRAEQAARAEPVRALKTRRSGRLPLTSFRRIASGLCKRRAAC